MAIQDLAFNRLQVGAEGSMLGYVEPAAPEELLPLDMYRFLLEPIRQEDAKREGAFFVKRFLEGPQELWLQIQEKIFSIRDLWSITDCPDEYLTYLKNIVGWTSELDVITDRLSAKSLRRLIAASIPLWKSRGSEDTLSDVLKLVTGAQSRIYSWFDYRWIADETETGEEHEGRDPWIIELPGPPTLNEYYSTMRIVDDGNLDRELVREIIKFMRASGERVEVAYVDFMERFTIEDDLTQWSTLEGTSYLEVEEGVGKLWDSSQRQSIVVSDGAFPNSSQWDEYVGYWRIKGKDGGEFGVLFYVQDDSNYYMVALDVATNAVVLSKKVAGAYTPIASYTPTTPLYADVWYGVRIHTNDEGSDTRIKIYVDSNEVIDVADSTYNDGSLGVYHISGYTVTLDEVEMFQLPLDTEVVDINS